MNCLVVVERENHWCENAASSLPQSLCRDLSSSRSLLRSLAEVSAALKVSRRPVQRFQQLESSTIVIVKSHRILNAPPLPQVLSGAPENALAVSESTLQRSKWGWEHLEELRSTGESYQSVWEVWLWLPDQFTFCWYQLRLDTLLFHSALRQHLVWYSSFLHNTPNLVLCICSVSCFHFSSECIILPLIPPFRLAAS